MSDDHIVTSFDEDMSRLEALFLEMGEMVAEQLKAATRALRKEDRVLAKQVVKGDRQLNKMEAELNDLAIKILALRQPFAGDLRKVVITLKSAGHLERIGDLTRNMAQRTNTITKAEADTGPIDTLIRMSEIVQDMIGSIMRAYRTGDTELATLVRALDQSVDTSHNALFREMLTYMMEDLRNISGCMHVMFMAKNIERMGDNVADIAKELIYMNTGDWPEGKRVKSDKTSKMILDPDNVET
ncbi:phosphate transport system regulatory protein PhoU [Litorimonas cladophorae]|uniref:Phosphate-specific transport system accessory protein PhoU n=1 Tax=Litorimonas cladophorae TaxID=1220491 RepID=A0A918KPL0_9PROT|nr:phosphate signaling complex protein PhoU [Litorimonas cladophorae]GGX69908.1 phosphate transport system regulatory protein PhoU [Litorimonas cladophorae]